MRIGYAARTLLEQVDGKVVGEPDQLGVQRSVAIAAEHARAVGGDPRVSAVATVGDVALVDFVSGRRGDLTDAFDLE